MVLLNQIINKGFDGGLLIGGLAKHVRNVLMAKDPQTLPLLEVSDQQRERYQQQAQKCETRFLYDALRLMNQCDINYRQSSNKRLLVELTLIEIAQLTQPDEGAGSGRKPRRLKSLFKHLTQQSQPRKAAPQVAAAGSGEAGRTSSPSNPSSTGGPKETVSPLKKSVGFSWNKLREKSTVKSKMQIILGSLSPNDPNSVIKVESGLLPAGLGVPVDDDV